MRVLVVGSGGREHALVWKLKQSPRVTRVYSAPGNAGISEMAQCVPLSVTDGEGLARFAEEEQIDLTVVGPEASLLSGVADRFEERGLRIFAPRKEAARIEGSKSFAKELMAKYGIPTGDYRVFADPGKALDYIRKQTPPIVIKADGLAAGKGVTVAATREEAEDAVRRIMEQRIFGDAGERIVVEEYLEGEELSLMAFVDGETVRPMVPAQDHKPVYDGDQGPNTGGMGAYSPVPQFPADVIDRIVREILEPAARAMVREGMWYRGVLYAGLMVTREGPKVIEFNARFGDPETQVVLPRLEGDLAEILLAVAEGRLHEVDVRWKPEAAVCVVMASQGYPGSYKKGNEITGLPVPDARRIVFHAGTAIKDGKFVTAGGRVLGVTALGAGLREAKDTAYRMVEEISFAGAHYRRDIADKALN